MKTTKRIRSRFIQNHGRINEKIRYHGRTGTILNAWITKDSNTAYEVEWDDGGITNILSWDVKFIQ